MKKLTLTDFCNNQLVNYASYDNIRSFASAIDGLNNAGRKVVYTVLQKNIKDEIKVSQLAAKVSEFTEYLHGNISGSIVGLAQDFSGKNNLPILYPEGTFGNRFIHEAAAERYIYTYKQKYTDYLFKKEDTDILIKQYFEGNEIEPLYFVPTIPMLLINGNEGPSVGFRQKILPRNTHNVIKALKCVINDKKYDEKLLYPYYNGADCFIEQGVDCAKWTIKGKIERLSITKVQIKEIPIGLELKEYIEILDMLEENKIINSYEDLSTNNKFNFIVSMNSKTLKESTDDEILDMLKLIKKDYEIYTCMDENNKIIIFNNTDELLKYYYKIKLESVKKRKEHQLIKLKQNLSELLSKAFFIMQVIKGEILVNNKKKDDIISQLENFDKIIKVDDSYDYLLRLPIYSLTKEKVEEIKENISGLKEKIKILETTDAKDIWLSELEELEKAIK